MKPEDMIFNEVHRQVTTKGYAKKTADRCAKNAADDYRKGVGDRGRGSQSWANNIIKTHVKSAEKIGEKEKV